jgi:hypothetical protein
MEKIYFSQIFSCIAEPRHFDAAPARKNIGAQAPAPIFWFMQCNVSGINQQIIDKSNISLPKYILNNKLCIHTAIG